MELSTHNHSLLPPAASFGWTVEAASAERLRYAATRGTMHRIAAAVFLASMSTLAFATANAAETEGWSAPVNGLQMRLQLKERPKHGKTRWFVPYLELRNVRNLATPMEVSPDSPRLRVELVYADGKAVAIPAGGRTRSGPHAGLGTIVLPVDSSISMGLECTNYGISTDAAIVIPTDWAAWALKEEQNGKVFLRATLKVNADKKQPAWKAWYGVLQSPLLEVAWK